MQVGIQFTHTQKKHKTTQKRKGWWLEKIYLPVRLERDFTGCVLCVCHTARTAIYHYAKEHRAWGRVSSFREVYFPFSD